MSNSDEANEDMICQSDSVSDNLITDFDGDDTINELSQRKSKTNIPLSLKSGKLKSIINQLHVSYPGLKSHGKHEVKVFDNFFRSLRDDKDWPSFCKLLYLYFEGVFSLTEFFKLVEDKFYGKLK